jgi:hypothetical protein
MIARLKAPSAPKNFDGCQANWTVFLALPYESQVGLAESSNVWKYCG